MIIIDGVLRCMVTLVVNKRLGIIASTGHDTEEDYDDFDPNEEIMVDVEVLIPETMFDNLKLCVEIPKDYRKGQIAGRAEQVSIPIEVAKAATNEGDCFEITDMKHDGAEGLLAVLRRKASEVMDNMRTKEELDELDKVRKDKARVSFDEQIARLEKLRDEVK